MRNIRQKQNGAEGRALSKGERMYEPAKAHRFKVGDPVLALAPTNPHRGMEGFVVEVVERANSKIYRYVVRFDDGMTATFFAFELLLL